MDSWLKLDFEDFAELLHGESDLAEEPVPLEVFLYDKYYLGGALRNMRLSDIQLEVVRYMTQIYKRETLQQWMGEAEGNEYFDKYTKREIVCALGKGSGKDAMSRWSMCYVVYLLHCLRDPLSYYNKAQGTYLDLLNIATNADQARHVFFDPLKNLMQNSSWFQAAGMEPRRVEFGFHSAPVRIQSGNSEAEAWEGLDLFMVVLDEIDAFKTEAKLKGQSKGGLSAENIYKMAVNSVASRFPELGKTICLSFPRSRDGFILNRYREAEKEPGTYRLRAATWEVNPTVTRESLQPMYDRDPVDARGRFEAEPPLMNQAYFRDPQRVRECFKGEVFYDTITSEYTEYRVKEQRELWPVNEFGQLRDWFICKDDYTRYIHIDLALKHDNCAIAMVHSPGTRKIETEAGHYETLPVIKMDLVHWWDALPGTEVNFSEVREFVKLLCRRFPVGLVTLDKWNSADFIQNLQARGINADLHSVKKNDYDTLKTAFYDKRFGGYFIEELVEQELLKLQILDNGKIDHLSTSGKDLSDALAGATWHACEFADYDREIDIQIITDSDWSDEDHRKHESDMELDYERQLRNEEMYKKRYRFHENSTDYDLILETI